MCWNENTNNNHGAFWISFSFSSLFFLLSSCSFFDTKMNSCYCLPCGFLSSCVCWRGTNFNPALSPFDADTAQGLTLKVWGWLWLSGSVFFPPIHELFFCFRSISCYFFSASSNINSCFVFWTGTKLTSVLTLALKKVLGAEEGIGIPVETFSFLRKANP